MDEQQEEDQQRNDQLMASAVQFLIDGGDEKAAMILLPCTLSYEEVEHHFSPSSHNYTDRTITLGAPRLSYDFLEFIDSQYHYQEYPDIPAELIEKVALSGTVRRAFHALIDESVKLVVKAGLVQVTAHWRQELLSLLRSERVTNQGLQFSPKIPMVTWNNLRFRSQTEIRIAQELDRRRVLFLPNCLARLGLRERQNREADFLICAEGKWGILEVDGDLAHPPTRTAEDHERDRLFQAHGILLAQHFAASECWENADGVVTKFWALLRQTR